MSLIFLICSQVFGLALGLIKSLVLPIFLSIEDFAFWQIYLLYTGYIAVFSFGFNDGLLVRYGKYDFNKLPLNLVGRSIKYFMFLIIALTSFIIVISLLIPYNDKTLLFIFITLNIPLVVLNGIFLFLLQSTNQIKKYSVYSVIDKFIMIITIFIFIYLDIKNIYVIIIVDMASRLVQILLMYIEFRKLFKPEEDNESTGKIISEIKENISRGSYILITNLIGMLLFGYGLFVIERFMSLKDYSLFSLGISTTNILLLFINAVSIVVFPYLSRLENNQVFSKVTQINFLTIHFSIFICNIYIIIVFILENYLEKYSDLLIFLPFIFLSVVLQIKFNIILYPTTKLLEREKNIFKINLKLLILSIIFTSLSIIYYHSLLYAAITMYIVLYLRNYVLGKLISIDTKDTKKVKYLEFLSHIIFITIVLFFENKFYLYTIYSIFILIIDAKKIALRGKFI